MFVPALRRPFHYGCRAPGEDPEFFDHILEQRRAFVVNMGWLTDHHDDRDRYDHAGSLTVFHYTQNRRTRAPQTSIRFTHVRDVADLLSIEMTRSNPAMHTAAQTYAAQELDEIAHCGKLFDATRAVVNLDIFGSRTAFRSLLQLYGYAHGLTSSNPHDVEVHWITTLASGLLAALNKAGIHPHVVTQGRVRPTDAKEAAVCVVSPAQIHKQLELTFTTTATRWLYENGLKAGIHERQRRLATHQMPPMFGSPQSRPKTLEP